MARGIGVKPRTAPVKVKLSANRENTVIFRSQPVKVKLYRYLVYVATKRREEKVLTSARIERTLRYYHLRWGFYLHIECALCEG
jgi:hypothetical protein